MNQSNQFDTKLNHALHDQVKNLIGTPIKITFTKTTIDKSAFLKSLFFIPDATPIKFTEIAARVDTSRGSIISEFLIASETKEKTCTLFTNYNYDDTAILDCQLINFCKLVNVRKKTRKSEDHLSKSLNLFHHWVASEISESLNDTGYLSKLHDGIEIQTFNLRRLSKY